MKRSEISEETRYVWECPNCGTYNGSPDDPDYEEYVWCEECNESFELED